MTVQLEKLELKVLSKETWTDFELLFGEKGACGQCWCMSWRLKKSTFEAGKKNGANKNAIRSMAENNLSPGLIAYLNNEPIAWLAFGPRSDFERLNYSRIHRPIDGQKVYSLPCFFIAKNFRRKGLSTVLLEKLKVYAKQNQIECIEAYPSIPTVENLPAAFLWVGVYQSFEKAGFEIVDRKSKNRPMVRWFAK